MPDETVEQAAESLEAVGARVLSLRIVKALRFPHTAKCEGSTHGKPCICPRAEAVNAVLRGINVQPFPKKGAGYCKHRLLHLDAGLYWCPYCGILAWYAPSGRQIIWRTWRVAERVAHLKSKIKSLRHRRRTERNARPRAPYPENAADRGPTEGQIETPSPVQGP